MANAVAERGGKAERGIGGERAKPQWGASGKKMDFRWDLTRRDVLAMKIFISNNLNKKIIYDEIKSFHR